MAIELRYNMAQSYFFARLRQLITYFDISAKSAKIYSLKVTYYRVKHRLQELALGSIEHFVKWMLLSCHLIISFGIGSIIITVSVPTLIWPYTVLEVVGILVFVYIFFSLNDYGNYIDSATNATEDVEKLQC